jgi:hypothetical protein
MTRGAVVSVPTPPTVEGARSRELGGAGVVTSETISPPARTVVEDRKCGAEDEARAPEPSSASFCNLQCVISTFDII